MCSKSLPGTQLRFGLTADSASFSVDGVKAKGGFPAWFCFRGPTVGSNADDPLTASSLGDTHVPDILWPEWFPCREFAKWARYGVVQTKTLLNLCGFIGTKTDSHGLPVTARVESFKLFLRTELLKSPCKPGDYVKLLGRKQRLVIGFIALKCDHCRSPSF